MKLLLIGTLILLNFTAYSSVLITSFDAFSGGSSNNSRKIALKIYEQLKDKIDISHCPLTTAYDYATEQIALCLANSTEQPKLVISLGEGGCGNLKLETVAYNWDNGWGADNIGQRRRGSQIIKGAPKSLGLNIDWSEPFCELDYNKQKSITLASNDAQRFVCNNTMYNMSYKFPELPYGFIHVPAHQCRPSLQKIEEATEIIAQMIIKFSEMDTQLFTPYETDKISLTERRERSISVCEKDFLRRLLTTY